MHKWKVERAGVDLVLAYERERERYPQEMTRLNKGFDILSTDKNGNKRFIEVKSLEKLWGEYNAPALTSYEYDFARQEGDKYWLYVVECALDDNAKIYRIQNPALQVNEYIYDDGWQELDLPETKTEDT